MVQFKCVKDCIDIGITLRTINLSLNICSESRKRIWVQGDKNVLFKFFFFNMTSKYVAMSNLRRDENMCVIASERLSSLIALIIKLYLDTLFIYLDTVKFGTATPFTYITIKLIC